MNLDLAHAEIAKRVRTARSSFYWPMLLQSKSRRQALFALYAYSKALDDIADGCLSKTAKLSALDEWRMVVEKSFSKDQDELPKKDPLVLGLMDVIQRCHLSKDSLIALIDGMEADANGPIVAPTWAELTAYADQVATAVGVLCLQIWGWRGPESAAFAHATGQALQLTNILRDLEEDAENGRLYVPNEALVAAGITERKPMDVIRHPSFPKACSLIAARIQNHFATAKKLWSHNPPKSARPAWIMLRSYEALFDKILRYGLGRQGARIRLTRIQKVTTLCRAYLSAR
ncbi:MAG: squalene/phytoene synthase family protein [Rhodospirillaceae bacterium]